MSLQYLSPGNGSDFACTQGYLTTPASATVTIIYAIVHQACLPVSSGAAAGRVLHSWSLYVLSLLLALASVSLA